MPEFINYDNVNLLSEYDINDDSFDIQIRDQYVPDLYEGSEDYFDDNVAMVQILRSEEHHRDDFGNKSEQI